MTHTESLFKTIILLQHLVELHKTDDIDIYYIDLFCGAGGTSTGVELATINGHSAAKVVACVNHDKNAIASHMANHPYALHFTEDMRTLDLSPIVNLVKKIRFRNPNAKIVLWASLECTNFSKAKGGQARDADSRTLAEHLFRYIDEINPDLIQIENVEEFMCWGDLDENGKPVSKDRGRLYLRWVNAVKKCGYKFDHRILNAADFGAYTSRKRFFGQFAKKDMPIVWPEATHCKGGSTTLFDELQKWKPVKDVLDLEDEGTSIFKRKKPLSPKTFERVYAGLIRHAAGGKDKWLLKYNSINGRTGKHVPPSIDEPCPTVSCQGRLGVVQTQFISKYFSGHPDSKNIPITGPAHTIKCKDNHSLVSTKFLAAYYGNGDNVSKVDSPCPTVPTKDRFNYVSPKFLCSYNFNDTAKDIQAPCPTLLTKDRLSLVTPFIMNYYSGGGQHSDINHPAPAILANPKQRLISCQFMDQQFGQSKPADTDRPLGAITANPKYNLVSCRPWVMNTNFANVGSGINEPAPVITANRKWHYLMNPQFTSAGGSVDKPCFTLIARMDKMPPYLVNASNSVEELPSFVKIAPDGNIIIEVYESDIPIVRKIKEFMAMYQIVDILMRMLKIPELKRIMGFPENYKLIGTQAEQKKYIGNAVEVNMARVLCEAIAFKIHQLKQAS
ncbi:DNA cytosine methyltransferase [Parabacteroides sp. GYB001]|uniref:DNA cytosine methyltransferase n=1 Tax=Parabacteroides leei TaxID=2939491 RepID=UPI0020174A2D|nr:DNA cytosine methyltransferase [Parabacteroides leei]MCL3854732.1 DNA cytosine methyltransferase [Parabacteroides leei]